VRELDVDVAVAGAGLAGLVAARRVAAGGASVVVLEARNRVGGRLHSEPLGDGKQVEVGGQWVGPTQDRVLELARELRVETFPTHVAGSNMLELGGNLSRYEGTIPRLSPPILADVALARRRIERLARRVVTDAPWRTPSAERLDSQTFASWLRQGMRTRKARLLMQLAGRTVWGTEPAEMSLLHVLFYVRSAGGFDRLMDTEGGAQQDRLVGGSSLLATKLADELGDRVALDAPVRRIDDREPGLVIDAAGVTARARRAIVAVPPPLRARIEFEPTLPPLHVQLAQRMAQGWLVKCTAVYAEPFWRADGLSGEALSETGPTSLTFDNSPPDGSPGALVGFLGGADARRAARLSAGDRRRRVLEGFSRLFGPRAADPERYIEVDWAREEWSGGGPTCYMPPGGWTGYGPALREPAGRVHWAGTETATVWNGYMDGAVRSGERAADEVLAAL
jgi:monoamine oxidase